MTTSDATSSGTSYAPASDTQSRATSRAPTSRNGSGAPLPSASICWPKTGNAASSAGLPASTASATVRTGPPLSASTGSTRASEVSDSVLTCTPISPGVPASVGPYWVASALPRKIASARNGATASASIAKSGHAAPMLPTMMVLVTATSLAMM